jgi:hypothetical protein
MIPIHEVLLAVYPDLTTSLRGGIAASDLPFGVDI